MAKQMQYKQIDPEKSADTDTLKPPIHTYQAAISTKQRLGASAFIMAVMAADLTCRCPHSRSAEGKLFRPSPPEVGTLFRPSPPETLRARLAACVWSAWGFPADSTSTATSSSSRLQACVGNRMRSVLTGGAGSQMMTNLYGPKSCQFWNSFHFHCAALKWQVKPKHLSMNDHTHGLSLWKSIGCFVQIFCVRLQFIFHRLRT